MNGRTLIQYTHMHTHRVLRFQSYLEVMTLLEEQHSGKKDIHSHKLFRRMPRTYYVPSTCTP